MQLGPSLWTGTYIDIPFIVQGFDRVGCHCWGLVWLAYKEQKNIELNKYLEFKASDLKSAARIFKGESTLDPWVLVADRDLSKYQWREFDVVLMTAHIRDERRITRIHGHVGLVCGHRFILHVAEDINSSCMRVDHPRIRNRILGVFRHKDLM